MTKTEHNPWVIMLLVYLSSVMGLGSAHGSAEVARADSVRNSAAVARGSHWKQVRRKTTYYHRYDMLCCFNAQTCMYHTCFFHVYH